jgi:uncharacterized Zn finger protein (UPF0148 family)
MKTENDEIQTSGQVVCPICGQKFSTKEEHDKHHKQAHPEDE